jgi:hypothetical protein
VASPGENRHNQRADRDYSRRSIRNRTNRRWRNATPVIFLSRSGPNKPLAFALTKLDADHPYFAERGLTADTIATFGLGFCNKGLLRGYAAIPIHNQAGDLIAYAGRWPGTPEEGKGKYKLPEGFKKSLELFNFHRAMSEPEETPLVIVEGFFDCMRLWQRGLLLAAKVAIPKAVWIRQRGGSGDGGFRNPQPRRNRSFASLCALPR